MHGHGTSRKLRTFEDSMGQAVNAICMKNIKLIHQLTLKQQISLYANSLLHLDSQVQWSSVAFSIFPAGHIKSRPPPSRLGLKLTGGHQYLYGLKHRPPRVCHRRGTRIERTLGRTPRTHSDRTSSSSMPQVGQPPRATFSISIFNRHRTTNHYCANQERGKCGAVATSYPDHQDRLLHLRDGTHPIPLEHWSRKEQKTSKTC